MSRNPKNKSKRPSVVQPQVGGSKKEKFPASMRWGFSALWFTIFFFTLLLPLFSGDLEPRWDARDEFYPSYVYFSDSINEGRFPLWDPYTSCGYPFHAEPHQPTLNPAAILIASTVTETALGFLLYWAVHWWWGGIGMMWLTRSGGGVPSAGLLAALAYTLSGFFIGNAQHTPFIPVAGWLPWIVGLADIAVRRSSPGHALLAGASLGLSALGGYPTLVSFTGLAVALWLSFRFLLDAGANDGDPRNFLRRAGWVAGTLLLMAIISIAIWSPILNAFLREGREYTDRIAPLSTGVANFGDVVSFPALFSLLYPLMTIIGAGEWMQADISMTNAYMGVLTIPLAIFWFLKAGGSRRPWWFLAFFLFMFLVSLGGKAGLRTMLYHVFPPLKYGRYSAIFRLYWIFALCFAAGLGFTRLIARPEERKYALGLLFGWTGIAVVSSFLLAVFLGSHGIEAGKHFPRLYFPALLTLPLGVAIFWLWGRGVAGTISLLAPALVVIVFHADMAGHLYNNMETVAVPRDTIRQVEMYHRRGTDIAGEPGPRHPPRRWNFFNVQQVIKEPIVQGYIAMQSKGFDEVLSTSRFVEVMKSPVRFWLSPGVEKTPPGESALAVLSGTGAGLPVPVFTDDVPKGLSIEKVVPGTYGIAAIRSYSPEKIEMDVEIPGKDGAYLASTERFAPGWKAWVDGIPQKVSKVNLYFRGIPVPAGRHAVTWKYEPELWKQLVVVSCLTLLSALGAGFYLLRRSGSKGLRQDSAEGKSSLCSSSTGGVDPSRCSPRTVLSNMSERSSSRRTT